jgi:hypothetical protein
MEYENGFKADAASRRVCFGSLFSKQSGTRPARARGAPVTHEKMIAQSRDRQEADPLADARGSARASIFETDSLKS